MPFNSVKDAEKSVPSIKNLTSKQKRAFVRIFNGLVSDGQSESSAIPIAIAQAKKVKKSMDNVDKALTENIRARLYAALNERYDSEGSLYVIDYDSALSYVYFEVWRQNDGSTNFRLSYSIQDGSVVLGEDAVEVVRTTNYIEKKTEEDSLADKVISCIEKYFGGSKKEHAEVIKALDEEDRMALFVVLEPQEEDSTNDLHGDTYTAKEVEKACINFSRHCNKANMFHRYETKDAEIVQNFTTPVSFSIDGERIVKAGSWLQWWYFPETEKGENAWQKVKKGEINGVSIGCRASSEKL